jgi:hypothetical protein
MNIEDITPEQQEELNRIYAQAFCYFQTGNSELAKLISSSKLEEFYKKYSDNKGQ